MALVTKLWDPKTGITLRVYSISFDVKSILKTNVFATNVSTKCLIEPPRALIDIRVTNYTHIHTERNSVHFDIWDYF